MTGAIVSRGFFQLRDHAPRVHLVLVLLSQTGEIVGSEKDLSSLETCHDREGIEVARQRVVRKTKVSMATVDRR